MTKSGPAKIREEVGDDATWNVWQARKVAFREIRAQLPGSTRTVSPEERRERIRVRQQHVKRRYRVF